ncbi:MAG: AAA family ATPase [Planctomycetota bacterium]
MALYGLKWNPFTPELPVEALWATPRIEEFAWRVENLVSDGGFALITGDTGTGKSVTLRILAERLGRLRDVVVGVLTRPQSQTADFYRELGEIFGVPLSPQNRWGGFKALRDRWKAHLESSLLRPVLLVDEAQEMVPGGLSELRLLTSAHFDSTSYLTVVLCGDHRLAAMFRQDELVPLASRIRTRLVLDYASREQLRELLTRAMAQAGHGKLMTAELIDTLVEHAAGNYRTLMTMAGELLMAGIRELQRRLDLAVVLVHHTRKAVPAGVQAGQGLRGSTDLHAFGDSNLYLRRARGDLVLTMEHRAAAAPDPVGLQLVTTDPGSIHLETAPHAGAQGTQDREASLTQGVLKALKRQPAMSRQALRDKLAVKNERLGRVLVGLERQGRIERCGQGWRSSEKPGDPVGTTAFPVPPYRGERERNASRAEGHPPKAEGQHGMPGETESGSAGTQPDEG